MQAAVSAASSIGSPRLMVMIAMLGSAGIVVSAFSLYHHFGHSKTSFCDLGQSFNCDLVNRSPYSTFMGVPVALIGIIGYLAILALASVYRRKAETPVILLIVSAVGAVFALYLTYLEAYVIHAWCILCLTSLGSITTITILSAINLKLAMRRS
jgi:vitamin-K-epoxide reductase (warfarin-sensitive)